MRRARTVGLVAQREFVERLASRAFQVSTAFTLVVVIALVAAPSIFGAGDAPSYTIGITGSAPEGLAAAVEANAVDPGTTAETRSFPNEASLRGAVVDGDVDLGVVDGSRVLTASGASGELVTLVTSALTNEAVAARAAELGVDSRQLAELLAGGPVIEEITHDDEEEGRLVIAFLGTVLLFVSIVTYGQWILIGVVEEKSSRVVEVVLGAVRPRYLLAGKVVGIGALGLIQLLLVAAVGVIGLRYTGDVGVPEIGLDLVVVVVGWFLLGFAFYASGYAATGSLVSRQEDAQNASFPLTLVIVAGYFVASTALGGGDNAILRVMSIVPPFSPMTMPLRQAIGVAAAWEVVVSVALMLVATVAMLRIGGRVYAGGLLRAKGKAREAFRSAEA